MLGGHNNKIWSNIYQLAFIWTDIVSTRIILISALGQDKDGLLDLQMGTDGATNFFMNNNEFLIFTS